MLFSTLCTIYQSVVIAGNKAIEPLSLPNQSDSCIEYLWADVVSDDPQYASRVTGICCMNNGKVHRLQQWFEFVDLYIIERGCHQWR